MTRCPVDHTDLKRDAVWPTLRYVGVQHVPADDVGPAETLELRDCPSCRSTLAKVVAS